MGKPPKTSFELTMERLRAADPAGEKKSPLSPKQKEAIAEARRVAAARVAEREVMFHDAMKQTQDPAEREKAEGEYRIDRKRIDDDCERAVAAIRRGR
jgi:predicted  nucleic acid-binding Zn-ribbon protein